MNHIKKYTRETLLQFTATRAFEEKLGETVPLLENGQTLEQTPQQYVLIGIPEDIGVRANHGRAGTSQAWEACLTSFCNIQNSVLKRNNLLLLGEVDCRLEMEQAATITADDADYFNKLGALVERIDYKVSEVVMAIVKAGKTPIIIGGGHNNAFGNIKGCSMALQKKINVINVDAHSDFRPLEHRHSGNGFSYAKEQGYLNSYYIFGLHENYASNTMLSLMKHAQPPVKFSTFRDIKAEGEISFKSHSDEAEMSVCDDDFGLEIDLDTIEMMGTSAMNPVGFSIAEMRRLVSKYASLSTCSYIHLCEGAPSLELFPNQVGKTLSYLITDIIA